MRDGRKPIVETAENRKSHRRIQREFLGGCGAVSVIMVVCFLVVYAKSKERYLVIGPTDPATGIRIEFSVSSHYHRHRDAPVSMNQGYSDAFDDVQYLPWSPSPVMQWFRKNVLRLTNTGIPEAAGILTCIQTNPANDWFLDPRGFIDVDSKRAGIKNDTVFLQEQKMVGGCPTTLFGEIYNGHSTSFFSLLVRPTGQTLTYMFEATGLNGTQSNPDWRELIAIRDSIRVVKAR